MVRKWLQPSHINVYGGLVRMENFIMISNKIVTNIGGGSECKAKEELDYLNILVYLNTKIDRTGVCCFTLERLITTIGYIPNSDKGKINDRVKKILKQLQSKGVIVCEKSMRDIKLKEYIECTLRNNKLLERDEDGDAKNYFKLSIPAYIKIVNSRSKENKSRMLNLYCNLLSRMNIYVLAESEILMCYPSYQTIYEDLGFTKETIVKVFKSLQQLGLMYKCNIGTVKNDGLTFKATNSYVLNKEDLEMAKIISKLNYKNNGFKIVEEEREPTKEKDENKKIKDRLKAKKSYLKKKIANGKATEKDIEEYNKLNRNKVDKK